MKATTSDNQPIKLSDLHFQMWDKYLTLLNKIWDLETTVASNSGQDDSEKPATHFHTTLWDQHLGSLNTTWQISSPHTLSPPTSLFGKIVFPLKKTILRWMQPLFDDLAQQQNAVIAQVVRTSNALVEAVNENAIYKLDAQREFNSQIVRTLNGLVDILSSNVIEEIQTLLEEMQTMLWTFDRRKEALEIEQIKLNQKLEQVLAVLRAPKEEHPDPAVSISPLPEQERQEDYTYLLFENRYRGDEITIRKRFQEYLEYFRNCSNVLDLGCGRGEFLELLRENHITGHGIDINQVMLEYCRKKELRVEEADALEYLHTRPDNSLDGIFSAQLIEHYSPKRLHRLLQACFDKLQSQKHLVLETQNPQSLYALSHFYRDLSHEKPVHPDALQFLLKTVGFQDVHVEYKVPFSSEQSLQEIDATSISDEGIQAQLTILNNNIRQLNTIIYGHLDYAIIARKMKVF